MPPDKFLPVLQSSCQSLLFLRPLSSTALLPVRVSRQPRRACFYQTDLYVTRSAILAVRRVSCPGVRIYTILYVSLKYKLRRDGPLPLLLRQLLPYWLLAPRISELFGYFLVSPARTYPWLPRTQRRTARPAAAPLSAGLEYIVVRCGLPRDPPVEGVIHATGSDYTTFHRPSL